LITGPITAQNNVKINAGKLLIVEMIFASSLARMIVEKIQVVARLMLIFGASAKSNFRYKKLA
jgi:hypothetical protein